MSDDNLKDLEELNTLLKTSPPKERTPPLKAVDEKCKDDSDENAISVKDASMWATNGTDYFATERAVMQMQAGQYVVEHSPSHGVYFSKQGINLDNLLVLPDSNSEQVLENIEYFWKSEEKFREHGFLWKRGIMLWGPPGSGKTSTVQQLSKQIVDLGGITIYCDNPRITATGLSILRKIEPNRPIVVILEDMDAIVDNYGESDLLAMLDGEHQTDNVVFVATTNYPQRLDARFINRPSRFDEIIKIGMPKAAARQCYLVFANRRLLENEAELTVWVKMTEGFSIAHLKELVISVECFGKTVEDAHARLRTMINATSSQYADDVDSTFGFVANSDNKKQ